MQQMESYNNIIMLILMIWIANNITVIVNNRTTYTQVRAHTYKDKRKVCHTSRTLLHVNIDCGLTFICLAVYRVSDSDGKAWPASFVSEPTLVWWRPFSFTFPTFFISLISCLWKKMCVLVHYSSTVWATTNDSVHYDRVIVYCFVWVHVNVRVWPYMV